MVVSSTTFSLNENYMKIIVLIVRLLVKYPFNLNEFTLTNYLKFTENFHTTYVKKILFLIPNKFELCQI